MPKRGSFSSGTVAAVPRKKQKSFTPNGDDQGYDEADENTPMTQSQNYTSQALRTNPEVKIEREDEIHRSIFFLSFIKMLVLFFE